MLSRKTNLNLFTSNSQFYCIYLKNKKCLIIKLNPKIIRFLSATNEGPRTKNMHDPQENWINFFLDDFYSILKVCLLSVDAWIVLVDNKKGIVFIASITQQFFVCFQIVHITITCNRIVPSRWLNWFVVNIWTNCTIIILINKNRERRCFLRTTLGQRVMSEFYDVFVYFPWNTWA